MRSFFLDLKLRVKLLLAFGSLLVLSTALVIWFFIVSSQRDIYRSASETTDIVGIRLLEVNAAIQYFMFEGFKAESFHLQKKSEALDLVNERMPLIRNGLHQIAQTRTRPHVAEEALRIHYELDKYFKTLSGLLHTRGFKDFGLEGELRQAIHHVENTPYPFNKASMLMLRRHEKDFFLRKDLKYVADFGKQMDKFVAEIESLPADPGKEAILNDLKKYNTSFLRVVETEEQIGLKETEGARGKINSELKELNRLVDLIRNDIKAEATAFDQQSNFWLLTLFALQLAFGTLLAILYADVITKAIKELNRAIGQLAEGVFPAPLLVRTNEEIGQIKKSFNQLLQRIQAATHFADQLGNGKLQTVYDTRFTGDILALSLRKMQTQLIMSAQEQDIVNWLNKGTAQFAQILQREYANKEQLGDQVLIELVRYAGLNQGALYLRTQQADEDYLERIATYAYGKKKYVDHRLEVGSGLVGQCVLEKETVQLTDIPADYVKITSGLGEATPCYVVLVPLLHHNQAVGVLELAGFEILKAHEVKYLEMSAEALAATIFSKQAAEETARLLAEAKQREEQLAAQEEELRQNAEEMQAVQEQMQLRVKELERELETRDVPQPGKLMWAE